MTASNNVAAYAGALTNRVVFTNDTTWFDAKGAATAATSGLATYNTLTNQLLGTNLALIALINTNGVNGTNFAVSTATALTNLVATNGINATNLTLTIGANATNYVNTATNGLVTAAVTNGLATTASLNTASNAVLQAATNSSAATAIALIATATNGLVTSAVTNGLATTNWVGLNYYPTSNPSAFITAAVTNGLANTNWVISYADTNGAASYFSKQATNGFTTMVYSNPAAFLLTNTLPALTNGFVTATVTNGLATTNWVSTYAIKTSQLPTGWTTNGLGRVLSSYTNVIINLAQYTNAEPLSFVILLTNNTTFAFVTNAPPGKSFFIEVQQGTASSMWTVNFNTNLTTKAAYWQPPAFGQFLAMPTNSSNSRQFIDVRIGNNGTNAFEWQNNIVR